MGLRSETGFGLLRAGQRDARLHILVVMGQGGHATECRRLVELMGTVTYRYSYILEAEDDVTDEDATRASGPVYRVVRPGSVVQGRFTRLVKFPLSATQAATILLWVRPDAIITTGPACAVAVSVPAKLLRVPIIFVETGARIHALSATGRFMRHMADLYIVQWEELLPAVPEALFAGRLV